MRVALTAAQEDHGKSIYGVKFHHGAASPGQVLLATTAQNRVSIYECQDAKLQLLQAYVDDTVGRYLWW